MSVIPLKEMREEEKAEGLATDYPFLLQDRLQKIKSIDEQYDLQKNGYVSYSGGFDSLVCSMLVDMALPQNEIPRIFCNTGLEYKLTVEHVKEQQRQDGRIKIILPHYSARQCFRDFGYPFKSKYHSHILHTYQRSGLTKSVMNYITRQDGSQWACPKQLEYQFKDGLPFKVSERCCYKLKKEPFHKYEKESGRFIGITGMRRAEKGLRNGIQCIVADGDRIKRFHPLAPLGDDFMVWFDFKYNPPKSSLYKPPFSLERTGCVGCPYSKDLIKTLHRLECLMPDEYERACGLFKPVYDEMKRINYRGF